MRSSRSILLLCAGIPIVISARSQSGRRGDLPPATFRVVTDSTRYTLAGPGLQARAWVSAINPTVDTVFLAPLRERDRDRGAATLALEVGAGRPRDLRGSPRRAHSDRARCDGAVSRSSRWRPGDATRGDGRHAEDRRGRLRASRRCAGRARRGGAPARPTCDCPLQGSDDRGNASLTISLARQGALGFAKRAARGIGRGRMRPLRSSDDAEMTRQ
jgi:hypothetical protein